MTIIPLSDIPPTAVEALLDRAFGSDRHGRTAYRLRAGTTQIEGLSFAMIDDARHLLGTIQCWPVQFVGDDCTNTAMILVGPVAVEPSIQRGGIGRQLMTHMLAAAARTDEPDARTQMLIGDPEYYARFFGFAADRTAAWRLPGPFEPRRLLARGDAVPTGAGVVKPRR